MNKRNKEQDMREIHLGSKAFSYADEVACLFPNSLKQEQVRKNTLAVCAGVKYLQQIGIPSDFENSKSHNPLMHAVSNVSDLVVPGGRLLFCVVPPNEKRVEVLQDVEDDCIGFVAVQLAEDLTKVILLGFVPISSFDHQNTDFSLDALQPLSDLEEILVQQVYVVSQGKEHVATARSQEIASNSINISNIVYPPHPCFWQKQKADLQVASMDFQEEDVKEDNVIPDGLLKYTVTINFSGRNVSVVFSFQKENNKHEFWIRLSCKKEEGESNKKLSEGLKICVIKEAGEIVIEQTNKKPISSITTKKILWPIEEKIKVEVDFLDQKYVIQLPELISNDSAYQIETKDN